MWLEHYILKGRHFPERSRERVKARMISLLVYFPGLALLFDMVESYGYRQSTLPIFELVTLLVVVLLLIIFPKIVKLDYVALIILSVYTIFLFTALYLPDENSQLTFFWFAALPVGVFYFLGTQQGIRYTAVVAVSLVVMIVLDYLGILVPVNCQLSTLIQLLFGYMVVSYILYVIEGERSVSERSLRNSLEGNKMLFKEMHHRTKNNMQVIMGLLETQSFKIEDPKCQKMLSAHVDRIKAMSFVHENLYTGSSIDKVDMHKYLGEILDHLQAITQHTLIVDIDYVTMDIKSSINIGLLVNEAVSNAIEHAYSAGNGRIDVSLKEHGERCELTIKDYGLGFNKDREFNSLGMILIEDLSASLPEGELHIDTTQGTLIQVYFTLKEEV